MKIGMMIIQSANQLSPASYSTYEWKKSELSELLTIRDVFSTPYLFNCQAKILYNFVCKGMQEVELL